MEPVIQALVGITMAFIVAVWLWGILAALFVVSIALFVWACVEIVSKGRF